MGDYFPKESMEPEKNAVAFFDGRTQEESEGFLRMLKLGKTTKDSTDSIVRRIRYNPGIIESPGFLSHPLTGDFFQDYHFILKIRYFPEGILISNRAPEPGTPFSVIVMPVIDRISLESNNP